MPPRQDRGRHYPRWLWRHESGTYVKFTDGRREMHSRDDVMTVLGEIQQKPCAQTADIEQPCRKDGA
jgi:hypothetical protein